MSIVAKALWYLENRYGQPGLSLDDVAAACQVSRFHLTRAFGEATGLSLMRYLRARRMTEAALALAAGAPDILAVALNAGYGSHEAFTRAFRDQFGWTPEAVRLQGRCEGLALVHPIRLDHRAPGLSAAPRPVEREGFAVTGLCARYTHETAAGIPAQWQRFAAHGATLRRATPHEYGVCVHAETGAYDYTCGVELAGTAPAGLTLLRIPPQRYAVFFHAGHISAIRMSYRTIFDEWLPASGWQATGGPDFERYDERFDATTGAGGVEIWIPVALP